MCDPLEHEQLLHRRLQLMRAVLRHMTAIRQAATAFRVVAREPFIADAAAHAVARAELTHGEVITLCITHKAESFVHRFTPPPWHAALAIVRVSVQVRVLPILPDYSVTYQPGLYHALANVRCTSGR